ncbi:MAG TPA: NapC/NirT family cytochrome c, partial [Candidatus Thermoplasmatota archaeon]
MIRRLAEWVSGFPPAAIAFLALLGAAGVATGGYYAFQTYDYIEHDNEFCLSCHLMREPYDRFAESEHRGLGCKACHKPTFAARSQMALTQILENPGEIASHAEVPNEKCAACHVEGDPEKWESIRSSAGHRIHLESDDPALQGLQCVECHSTSLHEFAPADATCGQSGCHDDVRVRLAGMSDLTIHCAACHSFNAPVPAAEPRAALFAAVSPDAEECLSCHAMRERIELPPDEPHGGACGACHNPHEQTTPEAAVASCSSGDCHDRPADMTAFHRGLGAGVLESCTMCHAAHGWEAGTGDCLACHTDIYRDGRTPTAGVGAGARPAGTVLHEDGGRAVSPPSGPLHPPLGGRAGPSAALEPGTWALPPPPSAAPQ